MTDPYWFHGMKTWLRKHQAVVVSLGEGDMPQSTYHLSGKTDRKEENITHLCNHFQSATAQEIEHI
jgi:hypothetical protein